MHLDGPPSPPLDLADETEASEPFAMASLVVVLWRKMRAEEWETMAMDRWGYSRMRSWLDTSGAAAAPERLELAG